MTNTPINPAQVTKGDTILANGKKRVVKEISFCPCAPEFVHLDKECYDVRFSTVMLVTK